MPQAVPIPCVKTFIMPLKSLLPKAWAIIPPVPTRRKPMFQYKRSKSIVDMAIPPIATASPIWPLTPTSTIPTSGTVMFARMLGSASLRTLRFICLTRDSSIQSF